jgi:hypothetical protein
VADFECLVVAIARFEAAIYNKLAKTDASRAEILAKMEAKIKAEIRSSEVVRSLPNEYPPSHNMSHSRRNESKLEAHQERMEAMNV